MELWKKKQPKSKQKYLFKRSNTKLIRARSDQKWELLDPLQNKVNLNTPKKRENTGTAAAWYSNTKKHIPRQGSWCMQRGKPAPIYLPIWHAETKTQELDLIILIVNCLKSCVLQKWCKNFFSFSNQFANSCKHKVFKLQ